MKTRFTLAVIATLICYTTASTQSSLKVISNGNVGVNTDHPIEKLQVNGAINIGDTEINAPGTIRWTGDDFEGFDGLDWKSLTQCTCDATEDGSSTNNTDDDATQEESSNEDTSAAGCKASDDIKTSEMSLASDWKNQLHTAGLGFSDEGSICYTISAYEGNTTQMIGLSEDPDVDTKYDNINYAFYHRIVSTLNSHRVYIWENNVRVGIYLNTRESYEGTMFCIKRNEDGEVQYYINDELVHTSEHISEEPLYYDNSFYGFAEGSSSIWSHQPSNIEITEISVCAGTESGLLNPNVSLAALTQEQGVGILGQNYPNPFIDKSVITYDLSGEIYVGAELIITNSVGQVMNRKQLRTEQGIINVKGSGLSSGIYQYTVLLDGVAMEVKQMVVD